jgi:hypothetical protein
LNDVARITHQIIAPPQSVAAPADNSWLPIVIVGLVLLLVILVIAFWRLSHKPSTTTPVEEPGTTPAPIVVPPPPAPVVPTLDFLIESDQRVSFTLDKPMLTIGRAADNDIVIAAPVPNADTISQHHARLRRDQDGYVVRDLGSKNGLTVNGRQTLENLLQDGDRLQFGEVVAIFHQSAGGAA